MRKTWIPVALAAVALAGCAGGGPTREEFEANVKATRDNVASAVAHISRSQSREQLLSRMDQAALTIDDAAADLEAAGAPDGFEDEASALVKSLHQLGADVAATAAQLRDPAIAEFLPGTRSLQFESWTKANRILRDLRRQGIDVKPWA